MAEFDKDKMFAEVTGQFIVGSIIAGVLFFGVIGLVLVPRYFAATVAPTVSEQLGPDGISMGLVAFQSDVDALAEANVPPFENPPLEPLPNEELAGDVYENVQILGHLTDANFNRLMAAMTEWIAPDEGCAYCHNEENYASDEVYTKMVARQMIQMTWVVNEGYPGHVNANGEVGVTCYTCHRGNAVPEYVWSDMMPLNEAVSGWAANQNRATEVAAYSSLPADALQAYFIEYEQIGVQSYAPREENEGSQTLQDAERTYSLMMHFSESLGVNCTFCHNSRAFGDWEQSPPQRDTAMLGISMVQEINGDHIMPTTDLLPEHRLADNGTAPMVACFTCHQGANQPLLGHNVIADWPELASQTPVYAPAE